MRVHGLGPDGATLVEVFAMADEHERIAALRARILAHVDAIGQAEAARRVAPLWGYGSARDAEVRLSRWRHRKREMSAEALLALLVALGMDVE